MEYGGLPPFSWLHLGAASPYGVRRLGAVFLAAPWCKRHHMEYDGLAGKGATGSGSHRRQRGRQAAETLHQGAARKTAPRRRTPRASPSQRTDDGQRRSRDSSDKRMCYSAAAYPLRIRNSLFVLSVICCKTLSSWDPSDLHRLATCTHQVDHELEEAVPPPEVRESHHPFRCLPQVSPSSRT